MQYVITTPYAVTIKRRRDAAHMALWASIYDVLEGFGLLDTKHAWTLRDQWKAFAQTLKSGVAVSAEFRITDGATVTIAIQGNGA